MNARIPIMRPRMPDAEAFLGHIMSMNEINVYSNRGPLVRALEQIIAEKLELDDPELVVVCSNATVALQGFLQLSEVGTWHLPAFTFPATIHAGLQSGKRVVLEDVCLNSWAISPNPALDDQNAGVLLVLPFGSPFSFEPYSGVENLLIDAAASIGSAPSWIKSLKSNWAAVFSLHATKCFGIGEGGVIVFGSKSNASRFRSWINFGFSGSRDSLHIGTNSKLSEIQAAVGLAVFENWDSELEEWLKARKLAEEVSDSLGIAPSAMGPVSHVSPYWIIYDENPGTIESFSRSLDENNIAHRRWWSMGCHLMPAFQELVSKEFPNVDHIAKRYLGLPFFRGISEFEVAQVRRALERHSPGKVM